MSRTNGIGNLIDVWEIRPSDTFTTTVTFGGQTLNGYLTNYEYDPSNNLKKVTQGSQPARLFNYDSLNRLKNTANPESGTTLYDYDENSNLKTKTDARGVITTFEYDDLNRRLSKTHSDGTPAVTYSYDTATLGVGRLTGVTSTATTFSIPSYDSLGRVKTSTQLTDGISYTMSYDYNRTGSLIRQTYPSGRIVDIENDNAGRIAGIKNGSGVYYAGAAPGDADAIQYSAHGNISTMKLGNNLWEHATLNSRLQTTEIGLGTSSSDSSKVEQ
jgi:YD repeat-containing protein